MSQLVQDAAGKIDSQTGKIDSQTGKIDSQTGKIAGIIPGKIRYRGQRGPDKAPRRYNPITLRNLRQYRNTIPQKTASNNWIWIVIGIVIAIIIGIVVWRVYEWWKENREDKKTKLSEQLQFEKLYQT